jgi:hypothetical protein
MGLPERVAKNEAIFREVNERIAEIGDGLPEDGTPLDLVCECSDTACAEQFSIGAGEYEAVRANPRRFLILPGHLWHPEVEREVSRGSRYVILEKFDEAGEVAAETDPRSNGEDDEAVR